MSAETPTTPVAPVAAAAAATPPATPPATTLAAPRPSRFRSSSFRHSHRFRHGLRKWRPISAAATRRPEPNRSSCSLRRARSRTRCASSVKRPRSSSTSERASRSAVEERAKRYALDGEVSRVLASQPLVPGGAEQLTQLWRSQFVVEPQGDSFTVRTPTFQSVGDFVTAQLARPEYAHFIRASNPGGGTAGTTGAHQAAPTAPANSGPADSAQELWRGDHPADARGPEESAHRSPAEPGRGHGAQFKVDGSAGVTCERARDRCESGNTAIMIALRG